jgi:2'-5' RNA ligase
MIRVFIGIPAPENIRAEAFDFREKLKDWPLRWVSGDDLHITLVPPWYVENADCVIGEINDLAKTMEPFKIKFKKITFGTSPKRPRLIWTMGEDYDREAILRLKATAETVFGQKADTRIYSPHLTIARFKEDDFDKFPTKNLEEKIDWGMEVNSVALYESKLNHSGAEYEILKEIEFRK